ncbi:hypothetical protein DL764_008401 [Monosporascus ibericus]|uniref:Uncharacterized protein n=1 Tax=Monosporascus ibericus TaxID=155417 RepID=A0A4V1X997_9PEZI|nr:hypothetical protein DL764_008401 [Monosporascus ibericus]
MLATPSHFLSPMPRSLVTKQKGGLSRSKSTVSPINETTPLIYPTGNDLGCSASREALQPAEIVDDASSGGAGGGRGSLSGANSSPRGIQDLLDAFGVNSAGGPRRPRGHPGLPVLPRHQKALSLPARRSSSPKRSSSSMGRESSPKTTLFPITDVVDNINDEPVADNTNEERGMGYMEVEPGIGNIFPITITSPITNPSLLETQVNLEDEGPLPHVISKDDVLLIQGVVDRRVSTPDVATTKKERGVKKGHEVPKPSRNRRPLSDEDDPQESDEDDAVEAEDDAVETEDDAVETEDDAVESVKDI